MAKKKEEINIEDMKPKKILHDYETFHAHIRKSGTGDNFSLIITIPRNTAVAMGLRTGDLIKAMIRREEKNQRVN